MALRKIKSKKEKKDNTKRNQLISGIILVVLMGLSTLGYALMNRDSDSGQINSIKYGGLTYTNTNGIWVTEINGREFYFYNLPQELENISIEGVYSLEDFYGKVLYLSNSNYDTSVLISSLYGIYSRVQNACIGEENCADESLPIKNCSTDNVIVFKDSDVSRIYKNESCIFIEGDAINGMDKLVYKLIGVV